VAPALTVSLCEVDFFHAIWNDTVIDLHYFVLQQLFIFLLKVTHFEAVLYFLLLVIDNLWK
jgi:hypothetical protein